MHQAGNTELGEVGRNFFNFEELLARRHLIAHDSDGALAAGKGGGTRGPRTPRDLGVARLLKRVPNVLAVATDRQLLKSRDGEPTASALCRRTLDGVGGGGKRRHLQDDVSGARVATLEYLYQTHLVQHRIRCCGHQHVRRKMVNLAQHRPLVDQRMRPKGGLDI